MSLVSLIGNSQKSYEQLNLIYQMLRKEYKTAVIDPSEKDDLGTDNIYTPYGFINRIQRKDHIDAIMKSNMIIILGENNGKKLDVSIIRNILFNAMQIKKNCVIINPLGKIQDYPITYINIDRLSEMGAFLIPVNSFYTEIVMKFLGGNNEVQGYNKYDGICHIVCNDLKILNEFSTKISNIKDILALDVGLKNIVKFCKNQSVPGVDHMNLSALLIHRPLKETSVEIDADDLVKKTYWYLDENEWKMLMDSLPYAGYPTIITHLIKGNDVESSIPNSVLNRSHLLMKINDDGIFLTALYSRDPKLG